MQPIYRHGSWWHSEGELEDAEAAARDARVTSSAAPCRYCDDTAHHSYTREAGWICPMAPAVPVRSERAA